MELDIREALRYLGVKGEPSEELLASAAHVAAQLTSQIEPKYVYRVFPLTQTGEGIALEGAGLVLPGTMAAKMLGECHRAAVLLCTLGAGFEAMSRRALARSAAQAALLDACGSVWVEAGCDAAQTELAARFPGAYLTDRFSPGYGDLPLALQKDICALLDGQRRLGVQVTESLLLNPAKSVTAVIGLSDRPQPARVRGCGACRLQDSCLYRKEGKRCAV